MELKIDPNILALRDLVKALVVDEVNARLQLEELEKLLKEKEATIRQLEAERKE